MGGINWGSVIVTAVPVAENTHKVSLEEEEEEEEGDEGEEEEEEVEEEEVEAFPPLSLSLYPSLYRIISLPHLSSLLSPFSLYTVYHEILASENI